VGLFFSCYHNYKWKILVCSFLASISTVGGGIYLRFLSRWSNEEEQQVFDKG
jgi:hypothetical protein